MRRFIILFSFLFMWLAACTNSTGPQNPSGSESDTLKIISDDLKTINQDDTLYVTNEIQAITHIDNLFETYSIENRDHYPFDSLNTKPALLILRHQNPDTLVFYLTYFYLKRYRYDLEIGHMGYEIRNYNSLSPKDYRMGVDSIVDPFLYEFFRFYNPFEKDGISLDSLMKKPVERISSGMIMDWLEKRPDYGSYQLIQDETDSIERIKEWINTLEYP